MFKRVTNEKITLIGDPHMDSLLPCILQCNFRYFVCHLRMYNQISLACQACPSNTQEREIEEMEIIRHCLFVGRNTINKLMMME